jgi:hypothetical protein
LYVQLNEAELLADTNLSIGSIVMFLLWAVSEEYIVIIGASIPSLCPLVRRAKRSSTYHRTYEMHRIDHSKSKALGKPLEV